MFLQNILFAQISFWEWVIRINSIISPLIIIAIGYWFNRKLEQYKTEIQTPFYIFQAQYSLYHQRKADAIEKLFELLAILQNELQRLISWEGLGEKDDKNELSDNVKIHIKSILNFYNQKRIFFDDDYTNHITIILNEANKVIALQDNTSNCPDSSLNNFKSVIQSLYGQINPTMDMLEKQFKELLTPENPHLKLKRK